jgi:hypothetical protein
MRRGERPPILKSYHKFFTHATAKPDFFLVLHKMSFWGLTFDVA